MFKICSKCFIEKSIEDFYAGRSNCKICIQKRNKLYKEKTKQYQSKYSAEHKDVKKKYDEVYRSKNVEKLKQLKKVYYIDNKEDINNKNKNYVKKNKNKIYEKNRIWRLNNKEKIKISNKKYCEENKEAIRVRKRIYTIKKYQTDSKFKLDSNFSHQIREALVGKKAGRKWESLVDYSLDDLYSHIEKQFTDEMSWNNYGINGWVIDHIKPRCSFNYLTADDHQFKECWSLNNLRPLMYLENAKKASEDKKQSVK